MKRKILFLAAVAILLTSGLIMGSCDLFGCPGDGTSGGKNNCKFTMGSGYYYQCSDSCITKQGTYAGGTTYTFTSSKSCNC